MILHPWTLCWVAVFGRSCVFFYFPKFGQKLCVSVCTAESRMRIVPPRHTARAAVRVPPPYKGVTHLNYRKFKKPALVEITTGRAHGSDETETVRPTAQRTRGLQLPRCRCDSDFRKLLIRSCASAATTRVHILGICWRRENRCTPMSRAYCSASSKTARLTKFS